MLKTDLFFIRYIQPKDEGKGKLNIPNGISFES